MQDSLYERVHSELPTFNRQLESSKSVQERLETLSENISHLSDAVSNGQVSSSSRYLFSFTTPAT